MVLHGVTLKTLLAVELGRFNRTPVVSDEISELRFMWCKQNIILTLLHKYLCTPNIMPISVTLDCTCGAYGLEESAFGETLESGARRSVWLVHLTGI
jgi:hypothetical protein